MGRIYLTTNLINGKVYIGRQTGDWKSYLGGGKYFKNAINKYGKNNFHKTILEDNINNNDLLNEREIYWIAFFDSTNRDIGYNITNGGGGMLGLAPTQKTKDKLSKAMMGKYKGKILTQKHRDKLSKALKGKIVTQETRTKMSKARVGELNPMYGKGGELNPMYGTISPFRGKHHTQETKDKISETRKAYWQKRRLEQNKNRHKMADLVKGNIGGKW